MIEGLLWITFPFWKKEVFELMIMLRKKIIGRITSNNFITSPSLFTLKEYSYGRYIIIAIDKVNIK